MQKLEFESAWDRTLALPDRLKIEQVFSELDHEQNEGQQSVILKTAFNHKNDFLVTVLVNNYAKQPFSLAEKNVVYKEKAGTISEMDSPYSLEVPAHTSMPWTFIFPAASIKKEPSGASGELILI
ncbi:SLAP domain-containing protein [Fictibacillus barbaricus]|uniref:SLAP domain-containing protein n=1 Tax=Fictibacillus barbaricus TaxID=182136 RepID=A0ABS2ZFZ8_9BACL|nr:SLAP domain-containing protein [Fictibacillus barbaricus]MBN3546272.1 SLAP domain-containing protein [Fictibacillus barbaricus]GGB39849.1 hypothetical protein GCM10007199_01210 [Fictibacillus barbaricus]